VSRSWIVGGALRDELLGREVTDIDIAVERDPQQAARELAAELRGPVFQLSEAFGAWRVVDRREGRVYDFAPLQGDTIEEDLAQRDFSVNAMARPLEQGNAAAAPTAGGELIDPLGGRADIEARTLRVLGPAAYENDPLRPLRLARFVAELGFAPDAETERL
jgi:poly(A) polymerase